MNVIDGSESLYSLGTRCLHSKDECDRRMKGVVLLNLLVVTKLIDKSSSLLPVALLMSLLAEQILPECVSVKLPALDRKRLDAPALKFGSCKSMYATVILRCTWLVL